MFYACQIDPGPDLTVRLMLPRAGVDRTRAPDRGAVPHRLLMLFIST
jgi:hypothetical protein